ncbi:ionotropic receptor 25a [Tribolium madens]|uniref:ionotropic receptor 25a n=1 Tax=Tribolium madens TaxID=41895 RepID=UPI001CF7657C|nr:ionotropic receptor 25a [Tribolium madens]
MRRACFLISFQVVLKESGQDYVPEWFQQSLKASQADLQLEPIIIELEGDDEDRNKICEILPKGGIIIDLTWTGNEQAEKVALDVGILYVKIDISISPALLLLDKFLEYRNSTDVTLIFDNPEKVDEALYFWIDTTLLRMVISESLDKTTANRLKAIRPIPNNFAIVATSSNMEELLETALDENLVTLPERWNLVFLDFQYQQFDKKLLKNLPINSLYMDKEICCKFLKTEKCECPHDFNLQENFLSLAINTLMKILKTLITENLELTSNLNCDDSHYSEATRNRFYELLQQEVDSNDLIYKENFALHVNINGIVEIGDEKVAEYNYKTGVTVLDGKKIEPITPFFRIGITHALPWSYKETDSSGNTYWTGYCVDFTEELSKLMGFGYEFVEPKSGTFGKKKDGVWDGVVGDLATGETDLAITALIMTADREEVIDYVAPYFEQTGITIVMRKPVRKTSLFKFMTVLKLEVWLSIVGALIVTGFMVWFLDKYSPYSARNNKKAYPYPTREFTLKESFWFALTSFTPQGGGEAPKALSGRTLVAAYWLFVVLMLATFTANLAAFLTVERMQTPVQSLEQLAKQSRINYTVVKDSDTHKYFINMKHAEDTLYRMWKELTLNASTDDTQYRVWDYPIREQYGHILLAINDSNPVPNASEGFRIVNEHTDADFAFIHDSSEIKYEISKNCNLTEVGEVFAERPYAVAVQQGSHLQDEISKTILNLQKDRFFEQLQAKYWNHSGKGSCPTTDDNEGITLESLGGVFIATLFGLALAMITLVGEVLYYRRKSKIENSDTKKPKTVEKSENWKEDNLKPISLINKDKQSVTIGTEFKPVNRHKRDLSEFGHITLYPRARNRITQTNNE